MLRVWKLWVKALLIGGLAVLEAGEVPDYLVGVNLAGAEFGSLDSLQGQGWDWPSEACIDYWYRSGIRLVRLPFKWERMQPILFEELDRDYLAGFDRTVGLMAERGMYFVPDLHNYNWYRGESVGTVWVPVSAFADFWHRMAAHLEGNQWIWGYGLMNEPWADPSTWQACAQAAIDAIRSVDLETTIIVANSFPGWLASIISTDENATPETLVAFMEERSQIPYPSLLNDPSSNICFEEHTYFDHDASGKYINTYEYEINRTDGPGARVCPEIGIQRMKPFVEWLKKYNVKGFVGEYGGPAGPGVDPRWTDILENTLQYMDENRLSSTFWAAGERWPTGDAKVMSLSGWPATLLPEERIRDRPQLQVLKKYLPEAADAYQFEIGVGHRIGIDFGPSNLMTLSPDTNGTVWYNVFDPAASGVVSAPYLKVKGEPLDILVSIVQPFDTTSIRGSKAEMEMPLLAGSDCFQIGSDEGHDPALQKSGEIRIDGLPLHYRYKITLFSSCWGDDSGNGRLTRLSIGTDHIDIEAANNADTKAVFDGLVADPDGGIAIKVSVSPDGTARYAYLNALELEFLDAGQPTTWAGYPIDENDFVDTSSWMGKLWTGNAPWLFSIGLQRWLFLPEEFVTQEGAWAYISR